MSRRDLGSLFDEEGQGATPVPSEAQRPVSVETPLLNDEARQMLEERSRAAREAAARAAEVAAQKGKEIGMAALGALGRMKEEHQSRAQAKAEATAAAREAAEPELGRGAMIAASIELPTTEPETRIDANPETKRSHKYVWLAALMLALVAIAGGAYWWSTRPISESAVTSKTPLPEARPAEKVTAPVATDPIQVPDMTAPVPVIEREPASAYGGEPIPATPVIEQPAKSFTPPEPNSDPVPVKPEPNPNSRPRSISAPVPAASNQEDQQIEQIQDFGKQLDALSGR